MTAEEGSGGSRLGTIGLPTTGSIGGVAWRKSVSVISGVGVESGDLDVSKYGVGTDLVIAGV